MSHIKCACHILFRNENITILAIVSSHPKNFAHREAIRLTWGNEFNNMHSNNPEFDGQIIFQVGLENQTLLKSMNCSKKKVNSMVIC